MSEVTDALQELHDGKRTLDDVVEFFRARDWPEPHPPDDDDLPLRGRPVGVRARPEDGSFSEVAFAYGAGTITLEQYTVLAKAAAEKINRQTAGQTEQQEAT